MSSEVDNIKKALLLLAAYVYSIAWRTASEEERANINILVNIRKILDRTKPCDGRRHPYGLEIPLWHCMLCGKDIGKGGRVLIKDRVEDSGPHFPPITHRRTLVVCPEHQKEAEDRGFKLDAYWNEDGIIHEPEGSH